MSEYLQPETCPNCDTPLMGKFCYACGQKKIEAHERTFFYFVRQFFGSTFFLENNFLKNLWQLVSRPGFLLSDYLSGKRKRHMAPLSLFLLINLFYFIFSPLSDLNPRLWEQTELQVYSPLVKPWVEKKLERKNLDFKDYEGKYNIKSLEFSKILIILNVPIFAMFISAVYLRRKFYFADHFIFSLYFFAFVLISVLLLAGISSIILSVFGVFIWSYLGPLFLIMLLAYLIISLRTVYQDKMIWIFVKSIVLFIAFIITHMFYRFMLFIITFFLT